MNKMRVLVTSFYKYMTSRQYHSNARRQNGVQVVNMNVILQKWSSAAHDRIDRMPR